MKPRDSDGCMLSIRIVDQEVTWNWETAHVSMDSFSPTLASAQKEALARFPEELPSQLITEVEIYRLLKAANLHIPCL